MNAAVFRRGEAITRLENYAHVIVEHLALVTWYPRNSATKRWKNEINAFLKSLERYNTAKGKKNNFTTHLTVDALRDTIATNEEKDYLLIGVESHGVKLPKEPDCKILDNSIKDFAKHLLKK